MSNQLKQVYRALLLNEQVPVVPDMQRRIAKFASSCGDTSLIVSLLGRRDVDEELEKELSLSDDLEVLAAWASDSRRTSEDLRERLKGEKRVGALLPLARRRGLPDDVYSALADRNSVRIAEALAENSDAPSKARIQCLEFLAARPTWNSSSTTHELSRWMRSEEDAAAVIRSAVHINHLRVAVESQFCTAESAEVAASRLKGVAESVDQEYSYSWSMFPVVAVLSVLRKFPLSDDARKACLEVVEMAEESAGSRSSSSYYGARVPSLERVREAFDPDIEGFDVFLRRLSDDSYEVRPLADKVFSSAADDTERRLAVEALLSRREVPDDLLRRYFVARDATTAALGNLFTNLLSEGRVEILAELSQDLFGVDPRTLGFVQQHQLGRDLVLLVSERCRDAEVGLPGWIRELLRNDRFADLAIEVAQWPELSELLTRSYSGHVSVLSSRVQEILISELGDDEERWSVFSELAGSFSGSLRMLIQTVKTLA